MHRSPFDSPKLRATLALSGLSLLAAACGGKTAADLDPVEQQLHALERALPDKTGDRLAGLCLDYASVCERAAGICLSIVESEALERRCQAINDRCERNLSTYCAGAPVRADAGVAKDADVQRDAGVSPDRSVSRDGGWRKDAWAPSKDSSLPPPRCIVSVSPAAGDQRTPFNVRWSTDGASCFAAVDDRDLGPVPCSGSRGGILLPPGIHVFMIDINGPQGWSECASAPFVVREVLPPLPAL